MGRLGRRRTYFSTSAPLRKGWNLARDPRCVIAVSTPGLDLVVEGAAAIVRNERLLCRVADVLARRSTAGVWSAQALLARVAARRLELEAGEQAS
jgi:hypothetical protein